MSELKIQETDQAVVFSVKVVPGSSRTALSGLLDDMLKVRIVAAPQKGKANQCLVELLAKKLGVKNKDISIISGHKRPVKQIRVLGVSSDALINKLNLRS